MFQLQNFSILTDVQFCTEGWGRCTSVQCTVAVTRGWGGGYQGNNAAPSHPDHNNHVTN